MKTLIFNEISNDVEVRIEIDDTYVFKIYLKGDPSKIKQAFNDTVPDVREAGQVIFGVHNWLGVITSEFVRDPTEGTVVLKIWSRSYPKMDVISRLFDANFN